MNDVELIQKISFNTELKLFITDNIMYLPSKH